MKTQQQLPPTESPTSLDALMGLLSLRVAESGSSLDDAVQYREPMITAVLDALSLSWFRKALQLEHHVKKGYVPSSDGFVSEPLFEPYKTRFLSHCNAFDASKAAVYLGYEPEADLLLEEPEPMASSIIRLLPQVAIEIDLIQRTGRNLPQLLAGEVSFFEVAAPRNDTAMLEALYFGSSSVMISNAVFSGVFASITEWIGRPIKVLEIGAGTGGATSAISHLIEDHCSEHWFTDISNIFLAAAKRRFPRLPLRYEILDANDASAFRRLAAEQFDVVIGANSIHTVSRVRNTLRYIRQVLRPDGVLLLLEAHRIPRWLEFIFGTASEWWTAQDTGDRSLGPLSSVDQWTSMLLDEVGNDAICPTRDLMSDVAARFYRYSPQIYVVQKGKRGRCTLTAPAAPPRQSEDDMRTRHQMPADRNLSEASPRNQPPTDGHSEPVDSQVRSPLAGRSAPGVPANPCLVRVSVEMDGNDNSFAFLDDDLFERHIVIPTKYPLHNIPRSPKVSAERIRNRYAFSLNTTIVMIQQLQMEDSTRT